MATSPAPLLVFWDIDHTLISVGGLSRVIYSRAFEAVTGRQLVRLADMSGRTERAIATETLELNGVDPATSLDALYQQLGEVTSSLKGEMRKQGRVLDGAADALASFANEGAVQSVVTGNIKSIAMAKLESLALDAFIDFEAGGYGDEATDRAVLLRNAVERAERIHQRRFEPAHAVVVGDTPHDVKGALDNGALAVGVATGASSAQDLKAAGADLVLDDLVDLRQLRALILTRRAG
jgi:phosphoglycolate phosphatase